MSKSWHAYAHQIQAVVIQHLPPLVAIVKSLLAADESSNT